MRLYSFEKLNVWKDSIELVKSVYEVTKEFPSDEKFGLISQLRRCSVSIASNLAEGTSRQTNKDKAHFTTMAFSSSMELLNQIIISKELNFLDENEYVILRTKIEKITNMLNALRKSQING
ncbi:four helix bundle protein [Hyunsoonleella flava]|uniref:Four helix bundle protein n=1 Tax=Hyunsoonleella flava TaxID=2527939 RepID=A0A4Q9FID3_9FLAO|nr:four helix bundle protein [Hyunsoonleella flava]TBN06771.1 four helix bundle protein [Hyunsoonleella flava]